MTPRCTTCATPASRSTARTARRRLVRRHRRAPRWARRGAPRRTRRGARWCRSSAVPRRPTPAARRETPRRRVHGISRGSSTPPPEIGARTGARAWDSCHRPLPRTTKSSSACDGCPRLSSARSRRIAAAPPSPRPCATPGAATATTRGPPTSSRRSPGAASRGSTSASP